MDLHICTGFKRATHEEIVFSGSICPACKLLEQICELEAEVDDLRRTLDAETKFNLMREHEARQEGAA